MRGPKSTCPGHGHTTYPHRTCPGNVTYDEYEGYSKYRKDDTVSTEKTGYEQK
jgi:hypothetical protein